MAIPDLDEAVYDALTNDAGVSALVSSRVYNLLAPSGSELPYIVFYIASGVIPNAVPHEQLNYVYRVDCWAYTRALAEDMSQAVYTALHKQTLTLTGWTNYRMQCEQEQRLLETFEGRQYHRNVWDVRILASKD